MTTATLTSSKRALLSLSHAMEHAVLDQLVGPGDYDGLVVGLFQRREYFDVERERYARLASLGVQCVVAFVGSVEDMPPGVHGVGLDAASPLAQEWSLVILDASTGAALVARDTGDLVPGEDTLEAARLFEGTWTFQRDEAAAVATRLLDAVAAGLDQGALRASRAVIATPGTTAPDPHRDRLTVMTQMLVSRIDQAHQRSQRLNAALSSSRRTAEVDQLTGLNNRHYLERFLGSSLSSSPVSLAAALVDLDGLKGINDTYGHAAGDAAIQTAAETIRANTRDADVLCRLGGDEFLVLMPGFEAEAGLVVGQRIAAAMAKARMPAPWAHVTLGASVGVAMAEPTKIPIERLDSALYDVKRTGKGTARLAE